MHTLPSRYLYIAAIPRFKCSIYHVGNVKIELHAPEKELIAWLEDTTAVHSFILAIMSKLEVFPAQQGVYWGFSFLILVGCYNLNSHRNHLGHLKLLSGKLNFVVWSDVKTCFRYLQSAWLQNDDWCIHLSQ